MLTNTWQSMVKVLGVSDLIKSKGANKVREWTLQANSFWSICLDFIVLVKT